MKIEDIKKVLIIGCGTMGLRIGLRAAMSGYEVVMYDISEKALEKALKIQDKILEEQVAQKRFDTSEIEAAKNRITTTTDPKVAARDVDIVSESVIEEVEPKVETYQLFAPLFPEHTVITTNTSYMLPSMFAEFTGKPERFAALHFHDVFLANVVDVMPHPGTEEWVTDLLVEFGKTLHQIPVVVNKEHHGYLFNTMLLSFLGAAGDLLSKDIASIEDIDRSWMGNFKMHVGPFGIFDSIGLDTAWHVVHNLKDNKSQRFAAVLKEYIDAGKLGIKTGEGFYKYPNPRYQEADFLRG